MKLEIDRGYDWLVVCIVVALVVILVGAKYEPVVVNYFTPNSIALPVSGSDVEGVVPPPAE